MAVYRRSRRHRFVLVLLALTSVTAITLDYRDQGEGAIETVRQGARDAFAPVQAAAGKVFSPVGDFFSGLTKYRSVKAENKRLRVQLEEARAASVRAADAERVRRALLGLQGLSFGGNIPAVSARVISEAPSNFQLSLVIDQGSEAGVSVGMPVVTGAGLAGRIVEASRDRATILLLTDRSSSVGIRLTGSGAVGLATGAGQREPMPVDLIALDTPVSVGEAVVTSGLQESLFPPDIPVGRVKSAKAPPGASHQEVTVEPVVDLRRLEFVKVLKWKPE